MNSNTRRRYEVTADGWLAGVWRRAGESVAMTDDAAKFLVLSGQLRAAAPASSPLDLDHDGTPGGSLPAKTIDVPGTAAELADRAERGDITFNTLRVAARWFLGDVPAKKADIIAALRRLTTVPAAPSEADD